jgi:outer membrane scaffolding protein for murein synthesis (MipA/OmpV family)
MRVIGIQGAYDLTPRWSLTSNLEHHHLGDNAAKSPFVTQRGGVYFSAGLSYRF